MGESSSDSVRGLISRIHIIKEMLGFKRRLGPPVSSFAGPQQSRRKCQRPDYAFFPIRCYGGSGALDT